MSIQRLAAYADHERPEFTPLDAQNAMFEVKGLIAGEQHLARRLITEVQQGNKPMETTIPLQAIKTTSEDLGDVISELMRENDRLLEENKKLNFIIKMIKHTHKHPHTPNPATTPSPEEAK
jgi:hypothetical protein